MEVPHSSRDAHTDTETYVTSNEEAEFEPQRACTISQDIHALCIDVTKETS